MGIERFFSSLNNNFNVVNDLRKPYKKIECTHFFIDFNSIIHNVSSKMIQSNYESIIEFETELINSIKNNILTMLNENLIKKKLKYIMFAIDGVPTFAKMMEQKKRRYMSDLINNLMKKLKLPIDWNKNNISPGTQFMDKLCKELNKIEFIDKCKTVCTNLIGILVSDVYNPGEGEMKIINCMRNLKSTKNKICVYSPDSDMILLLMLLNIPTILLRYDQQKSQKEETDIYNLIDVNSFKKQLVDYCLTKIDTIDEKHIINEIVYIFTIFGDDFLPKLESIQVSSDINYLLDNYMLTLKDKGNILTLKDNMYSLNSESLKYLFNLLSTYEILDLNRNFYNSKYKNYIYATNNNLNMDINVLKDHVNKILLEFIGRYYGAIRIEDITCTPLNVATCIDIGYFYDFIQEKNNKNKYVQLINNTEKSDEPFYMFSYNILKIIDGNDLYNTLYGYNMLGITLREKKDTKFMDIVKKYKSLYYLKIKPTELINELILYLYLRPINLPFVNFNRNNATKYENLHEKEFDSKKHIKKIKQLEYNNTKIEKKKLEYMINNKLDEYYKLFNPIHPFYNQKIQSVDKYYEVMFPKKDKNSIISKYIEGFYWVLNYYINNQVNYMWFYPYARTPLLSDLKNALYENTLEYDNNIIFNPLESIIFITPLNTNKDLNFLPDIINIDIKNKINKFITNNSSFFSSLSDENALSTNLLDCSVSIFLSKCHYKLLDDTIDPYDYIKKFRELIPLKNQIIKNKEIFKCIEM